LVRNLRLFLLQAAHKPGWSIELEDLLVDKLDLQPGSKQHALQVGDSNRLGSRMLLRLKQLLPSVHVMCEACGLYEATMRTLHHAWPLLHRNSTMLTAPQFASF
jgi:hypothetical protein